MADEEQNETTEETVDETVEAPVAEEPVAEAETPDEPAVEEPEAPVEEEAPAEELEPAAAEAEAEEPTAEPEAPAEEPAAESEAEEPVAEAEEPAAEAEAAPAPPAKRKRKPRPRSERRQRPKPVRASEGRKPLSRLPKPEHERGARQERRGVVVSSAMDKTIVVRVETLKAHRRYKKIIRRSTKFHAHDERNEANVGDLVRIVETRPLSKTKRWRLAEVVEAAK
jgi:small subunit ribosomal protein S17